MKIKGRPCIDSDFTDIATNKSTRNHHIQKEAKEMGKKKLNLRKHQTAMVASWFSPKRYKGFTSKNKK